MSDRSNWDPEMAAFTAAGEAEAKHHPPIRLEIPLEPHRRTNDALSLRTAAGGPEKRAAVEALGAERCVDYRSEDFVAVVREATGGAGVDVVLDIVGADYVARNIDLLRMDGRLMQIGGLGGADARVPFHPILRKRLWISGSMLRPRPVEEKGQIVAAVFEHVWPLLESGRVKPVIDRTFPLVEAAAAHRRMEASAHVGKIVLVV